MFIHDYLLRPFIILENGISQQYIFMTFIPVMISFMVDTRVSVFFAVACLRWPTLCAIAICRGIISSARTVIRKQNGPTSLNRRIVAMTIVNTEHPIPGANSVTCMYKQTKNIWAKLAGTLHYTSVTYSIRHK